MSIEKAIIYLRKALSELEGYMVPETSDFKQNGEEKPSVPYKRFKKVIDEKNNLKNELDELRKSKMRTDPS